MNTMLLSLFISSLFLAPIAIAQSRQNSTAYDQYALRAFAASALDYVLKPFDEERFNVALQRAKARLHERRAADLSTQLQTLLATLQPQPRYLERLVVKQNGRIFFLPVDDITPLAALDSSCAPLLGYATTVPFTNLTTNKRRDQRWPRRFDSTSTAANKQSPPHRIAVCSACCAANSI